MHKWMDIRNNEVLFSSESVTEGHPDKVCDQISDAVLDAILARDPQARVACETLVTTGLVFVTGEISTSEYVDIQGVVRGVLRRIGYGRADLGFDAETCAVLTAINEQSPDISQGVTQAYELREGGQEQDREDLQTGAGDQGMMFGYACDETDTYMPLSIDLAHRLTRELADLRKSGRLPGLRPDGKAQVTVRYRDGKAVGIKTVVVSTQHDPDYAMEDLRRDIMEQLIKRVLPAELLDEETEYYINPTGRFELGGPMADSGLTGRKLIVDTYGGRAAHGGGSFSGKDPTKVDRSACYAARYIAKNLVAAGLAQRLQVQLAYSIGVARPVSIAVETYGTARVPEARLVELIQEHFPLTPQAIIRELDLRRPIYEATASYGHFGRQDLDLPWERLDKVEVLRQALEA